MWLKDHNINWKQLISLILAWLLISDQTVEKSYHFMINLKGKLEYAVVKTISQAFHHRVKNIK